MYLCIVESKTVAVQSLLIS